MFFHLICPSFAGILIILNQIVRVTVVSCFIVTSFLIVTTGVKQICDKVEILSLGGFTPTTFFIPALM